MEAECSSDFGKEDDDETPIREKLSHMSLEELQQLKEKLGTKIFDEAMFGPKTRKRKSDSHTNNEFDEEMGQKVGRRVRRDMPLEMSSKIQPRGVIPVVAPIKKPVAVDPRFDSLYGTFDSEKFGEEYAFIEEQKQQEIEILKGERESTKSLQEKKKIEFAIKKMENELREAGRVRDKKRKDEEHHLERINAIKEGRKPVYYNKSELRAIELVEKYERMKEKDKVVTSIAKQRRKNASKNRKKIDVGEMNNF